MWTVVIMNLRSCIVHWRGTPFPLLKKQMAVRVKTIFCNLKVSGDLHIISPQTFRFVVISCVNLSNIRNSLFWTTRHFNRFTRILFSRKKPHQISVFLLVFCCCLRTSYRTTLALWSDIIISCSHSSTLLYLACRYTHISTWSPNT